jgi:hypothetical protein
MRVRWQDRATPPLLRSDFAQSTAGHTPNGDLTDSFVPATEAPSHHKAAKRREAAIWRLGRSFDMQTQPTTKTARSPIPGVIPEPVTVHYDAVAAHRRVPVAPTTRGTTRPTGHRARSDPTGTLFAGILSVMRNDNKRTAPSSKER